ncbi:MAG: hypothetical protein JSU59_07750 [Nitrospirota bacterium]|nr:MAG: hypothetical protein JSU59_07750 [Nitrospirota bacterium]
MLIAAIPLIGELTGAEAQVIGEKAEMDRLEVKAEEAMANGDPNGASLVIGRAALMASELAKKEGHPQTKLVYEGAEDLFRTQENAYRALALFEQAGGQHPAPSGVCQLLSLAENHGRSASRKLSQATPGSAADSGDLYDRLTEKTQEWVQLVEDLRADFSCT